MEAETAAKLAAMGMTNLGGSSAGANAGESSGADEPPVDMDALLSQSLSDIPDMAEYVTPKEGVYKVKVDKTDTTKHIGEKNTPAIQVDYTILEIAQEKGTSTGDTAKAGDKFSQLYFMGTQKGAAFNKEVLKTLLMPVAIRAGNPKMSVAESLAKFEGAEVYAVIKHRKDRLDKDIVRLNVSKIVFGD